MQGRTQDVQTTTGWRRDGQQHSHLWMYLPRFLTDKKWLDPLAKILFFVVQNEQSRVN